MRWKLLGPYLLFIFSMVSCEGPTAWYQNIGELWQSDTPRSKPEDFLDAQTMEGYVSFLASDDLQGRDTGSKGLAQAAMFIESVFQGNGIAPYFETYKDPFDAQKIPTYNVVGFLKGNDPVLSNELVIIGAHYDHIGTAKAIQGDTIANGANDNASGCAAVLALAAHLGKTKSNKRSVLFALFAAEEIGLLGSRHLAKRLKKEEIDLYTMINFEMIGVPLSQKSYQAYITGYTSSNMAEVFNQYAGQELLGFFPKASQYNLFQRSDNYPFYKAFGVPCQTICTFDFTNYSYYHHVDDECLALDFDHMSALVKAFIPALEQILAHPSKEIQLLKGA